MKWLVDNALSPGLADLLAAAGHDAVHVRRALALQNATDEIIFQTAVDHGRILMSTRSFPAKSWP
jgi:predicted nuclease of predicted toxin-antitoxin system